MIKENEPAEAKQVRMSHDQGVSERDCGKEEVAGKQRRTNQGERGVIPPHAAFNGLGQQLRVLVGGLRIDRSILFSGYKTFELLRKTV